MLQIFAAEISFYTGVININILGGDLCISLKLAEALFFCDIKIILLRYQISGLYPIKVIVSAFLGI